MRFHRHERPARRTERVADGASARNSAIPRLRPGDGDIIRGCRAPEGQWLRRGAHDLDTRPRYARAQGFADQ